MTMENESFVKIIIAQDMGKCQFINWSGLKKSGRFLTMTEKMLVALI